jgi:DMSO/TMAO reductase YedYZ molybdopterin-dependent catalytic subunit
MASRARIDGPGRVPADGSAPGTLTIAGDIDAPLTLTPADLKSFPRTKVALREDDTTSVYEGVLLDEILKRAGAPVGRELRGNATAAYVIASATDGYQVVFSLAELDPGFTANGVVVADTVDGMPLYPHQGPLRIVAPKDFRSARSIRGLERLDVVRLRK